MSLPQTQTQHKRKILKALAPYNANIRASHASTCTGDHHPDKVFEFITPSHCGIQKTGKVDAMPKHMECHSYVIIQTASIGGKMREPIVMNLKNIIRCQHLFGVRAGNVVAVALHCLEDAAQGFETLEAVAVSAGPTGKLFAYCTQHKQQI